MCTARVFFLFRVSWSCEEDTPIKRYREVGRKWDMKNENLLGFPRFNRCRVVAVFPKRTDGDIRVYLFVFVFFLYIYKMLSIIYFFYKRLEWINFNIIQN